MSIYSADTVIPKMISNTSPSGRAFASTIYNTSRDAWYAFNQTDDYGFTTQNGVTTGFIGYIFSAEIRIGKYIVRSISSDYLDQTPKDWTFEGSNDSTNGADGTWTVLDTRTGQSWITVSTDKEYIVQNVGLYKAYRLKFTANNGFASYTTINQIKMFELLKINRVLFSSESNSAFSLKSIADATVNVVPQMTSNTAPNGVVSASTFRIGWEPWKSFDRIDTDGGGWTTNDGVTTGWLAYEFPKHTNIASYAITAHSSASWVSLVPKDWTFEGSNDGVKWKTLDMRVNVTSWAAKEKRSFSFNNTAKYKMYRINVISINGGGYLNINELEMFEGNGMRMTSLRDSVVENDFKSYGADISLDTNVRVFEVLQTKRNGNTLGSGKTFTHNIDLNKFRINSIKL